MTALNLWKTSLLRKAQRLVEDSDRKNFSAALLQTTIALLHALATQSAHVAPEPKLERTQNDEGVALSLEWLDKESGWFLCVSVKRKLGEKPRVVLEFSGNPKGYVADNPTDADIRQSLHDYFQEWKKP